MHSTPEPEEVPSSAMVPSKRPSSGPPSARSKKLKTPVNRASKEHKTEPMVIVNKPPAIDSPLSSAAGTPVGSRASSPDEDQIDGSFSTDDKNTPSSDSLSVDGNSSMADLKELIESLPARCDKVSSDTDDKLKNALEMNKHIVAAQLKIMGREIVSFKNDKMSKAAQAIQNVERMQIECDTTRETAAEVLAEQLKYAEHIEKLEARIAELEENEASANAASQTDLVKMMDVASRTEDELAKTKQNCANLVAQTRQLEETITRLEAEKVQTKAELDECKAEVKALAQTMEEFAPIKAFIRAQMSLMQSMSMAK